MSFTACIITHDASPHLAGTLNAVLTQTPPPAEVLVVDSGSVDGTPELARRHSPRIRVIELRANLGPAAARNAGLVAARHDRILFVDDDVMPAPDCAARLLEAMAEAPRAAAVMPAVLHAHDPACVQYTGADAHFMGLMVLQTRDSSPPDEELQPRLIGSLVSACFLFDRSRRPDLRFDEGFFIYFEDHDFALRARIGGSELLAVPSARCHHGPGSAGLSLRRTGEYSRVRVHCLIRNRWQLLLKGYELRTLLLLAPALAAFELLQFAMVVRRAWWVEWLDAVRSTVGRFRTIVRERRRTQAGRVVRDRDLLRGGPLPFTDALPRSPFERRMLRLLDVVFMAYWRMIVPLL